MLSCNGSHICLTKALDQESDESDKEKTHFKSECWESRNWKGNILLDIKVSVEIDEVPDELIINWDETGIH